MDNIEITEELEEKMLEIFRLSEDFLRSVDRLSAELSGESQLNNGKKIKQTVTIEIEEV